MTNQDRIKLKRREMQLLQRIDLAVLKCVEKAIDVQTVTDYLRSVANALDYTEEIRYLNKEYHAEQS